MTLAGLVSHLRTSGLGDWLKPFGKGDTGRATYLSLSDQMEFAVRRWNTLDALIGDDHTQENHRLAGWDDGEQSAEAPRRLE